MNKRGFTLIETVASLLIIGILVNLAIPSFLDAKKTGEAIKIITDFEAIRTAVFAYYSDKGDFPADYYPGGFPKELKPYLPESFTFNLKPAIDATYDWDNWVVNGKPKHPYTNILYGISVTTTDMSLIKKIKALYKGPFQWSINQNYTFVLEYIKTP